MKHFMKLKNEPFESIVSNDKTYELRLYDEKRKLVKPNDTIVFANLENEDTVLVVVEDIIIAETLTGLFEKIDLSKCGFENGISIADAVDEMGKYYSLQEQAENSVVAIKIKRIDA